MSKFYIIFCALFCAGCANVKYGRVPYVAIPSAPSGSPEPSIPEIIAAKKTNAHFDQDAKGIRYYEASPYLLVFADGKGGIKWKIYYLPDQTEKRTIEPTAFLASVNTNHIFTNGILTGSKVTADGTAIPKALISAVQGLMSTAAGAALLDIPSGGYAVPPPQLYKIVIKNDTIELHGGAGDVAVKISVKQGY